jgi:hypothetical protein
MTERKPRNIPFRDWTSHQIRHAQLDGEFDDLPGAGPQTTVAPLDEEQIVARWRQRST